ncbi:hypothetical protein GOBAR_AA04287 [Gossypium barbadense]|uniref:Uncharacterized protein n=1 Tax=Gossypium barbadense TaxID=3634 RepID=A0A2P5YL26_GOSBA|nr:hypothetical protein GOBAR_AA04287 [Gossypium barbadense]
MTLLCLFSCYYHANACDVVSTRKENRRTCFQKEEGSVIFCGSNRENSSPSPTVPPRVLGRTVPNISGLTFNCWSLHRLGCCRTSGLIRQLSVLEFGAALGLYTEEFKEENELHALSRHIHFSPSKYWHTLAPGVASYNPSCSKASVLPPSLREAREHWCRQHPRRLLLMISPQGISSILSMRMIERRRGTYPPQYRLAQSTEEEAYEDIPDDVLPQYKGPPTQPPPPSRPVHAVTSYTDISKRLTRFEQ